MRLRKRFGVVSLRFYVFAGWVVLCAPAVFPSSASAVIDAATQPGLKILNAARIETVGRNIRITGLRNPEIDVPTPGLNPKEDYILTIRAKSSNPAGYMMIRWKAGGKTSFYPNMIIPLEPDSNFHAYTVDLRTSKNWRGEVSMADITFLGFGDEIEIEDITIGHPKNFWDGLRIEWKNFYLPIPLAQYRVNRVDTPFLFTLPFVYILNFMVVMAGALAVAALLWSKLRADDARLKLRRKVFVTASSFFLAMWLIYDLRETFNQAFIVRAVSLGYVNTDGKRSLPNVNDIYDFSEFVKANLPAGERGFDFYPGRDYPYPGMMKYLLYPVKAAGGDEAGGNRYIVVYKNPDFKSNAGGRLYKDGVIMAEGMVVAGYDDTSFIFRRKDL